MSRTSRLPLASSALAASVLLASLTSCGSGDTAEVGDTVRATASAETSAEPVTLTVPTGTVSLAVGSPVDEASDSQTASGGALEAPDGGTLVLVSVDYAAGTGVDSAGLLPGSTPLPTEVSLAAGDTEIDLGAPYSIAAGAPQPDPHSEWVAVPGDGSGLVLRVTFDGLTQTVDVDSGEQDLGAAAGYADLADAPLTSDLSCPTTWSGAGVEAQVSCTVSASPVLPWAPGVGWAGDGQGWRLVLADVAVSQVDGADAPSDGAGTALEATLGGAAPEDAELATPSSSDAGAAAVRWVFPAPGDAAGQLDLSLRYATDDTSSRVTLGASVPLPPAAG